MPSASFPVFCYFLFQKSYTGNILGIARDQNPRLYIVVTYTDTEGETEGSHEAPTQPGGATPPPGVWAGCVGPTGLPGVRPSPIYTPSSENPKYPIIIPWKVSSPPSSSTLDREGSGALPGTLPERRSSPEGSTSPCLHPVWCVSSSSLDYGSIAVARWLFSPLVPSCLDLVSCLSWSRSSYCNATCFVCCDPMNVDTMSSQSIELSCLCCLWSCMLSVVSRCFGQVDASDSKRGYLCSIVGSASI